MRSLPTVREAAPDDSAAVSRVHIGTWQVAYANIFPAGALDGLSETRDQNAASWRRRAEEPEPRRHLIVAEHGGSVAGFASLGATRDEDLDPEHVGELYAIYVLPDAWGKGVGQALMRGLLELLAADGFREARLWVFEDNPRSRRFYERGGWELDGARKSDTIFETDVPQVRYRIDLGRPDA